jgi:hypothetical protein
MLEESARFACDERFPTRRVLRLIDDCIARFDLDLGGLVVLTEAATGYYRVTPVIAAIAGAERVLALARKTRFGDVTEAGEQTAYLAGRAGIEDRIELATERARSVFGCANMVTNLGAVRPIDRAVIQMLEPTAVVSLMFGGNEWRPHEVDLAACWERGIAVAGVDEVAIDLFRFTGLRIVWFFLELGIELVGARLVFVGCGPVFCRVMGFLVDIGAQVLAITSEPQELVQRCGGEKLAEHLDQPEAYGALAEADALLTFDPLRERTFIGPSGDIAAGVLAETAPAISVVNYSGHVDRAGLEAVGIPCFPRHDPGGGHSANTIGEILPAPVIELHTAGLKVGEVMARSRLAGEPPREAEQAAVASGLGEDLRTWFTARMTKLAGPGQTDVTEGARGG